MTLTCNSCHHNKHIAFTCKSRFCNSCSKPASDKRLNHLISRRPQWLHYHHFIFTIPKELRDFFKRHRTTLKLMPHVASNAIQYFFRQKYKCKPGIVSVIHTFWAKLNRNTHVHIMLTAWWITPYNTFKHVWYIPFLWILASRKWYLLKALVDRVKQNLTWEKQHNELLLLRHISNLKDTNNENKSRYIYFSKKADSFQKVLSYIGRYLKRPVISQSRIKYYDWENITFEYVDKYDKQTKEVTTTGVEFVGLLLQHIPNKHFKMIYYSWIFAPRNKKKYLKIIKEHTWNQKCTIQIAKSYRKRLYDLTWIDICTCWCGWIYHKSSITIPWYKTKYFDTS